MVFSTNGSISKQLDQFLLLATSKAVRVRCSYPIQETRPDPGL